MTKDDGKKVWEIGTVKKLISCPGIRLTMKDQTRMKGFYVMSHFYITWLNLFTLSNLELNRSSNKNHLSAYPEATLKSLPLKIINFAILLKTNKKSGEALININPRINSVRSWIEFSLRSPLVSFFLSLFNNFFPRTNWKHNKKSFLMNFPTQEIDNRFEAQSPLG